MYALQSNIMLFIFIFFYRSFVYYIYVHTTYIRTLTVSVCTVKTEELFVFRCVSAKNPMFHECTATKIPFMYSFFGISAASAPISTFMRL